MTVRRDLNFAQLTCFAQLSERLIGELGRVEYYDFGEIAEHAAHLGTLHGLLVDVKPSDFLFIFTRTFK